MNGKGLMMNGLLCATLWYSFLLCGCTQRALTYEQQVGIPFSITLDWSALAEGEEKPQYIKGLFFPVEGGAPIERFISPDGGEIYVPEGEYHVIIYNWRTNAETQTVQFRGDTYETFEAYVAPRNTRPNADFSLLPCPDSQLYGWNSGEDTVIISEKSPTVRTRSWEGDTVTVSMSPLVHSYVVAVYISNAQYLSDISAVATYSYSSAPLGGGSYPDSDERYAVETKLECGKDSNGNSIYYCRVTTFGFIEEAEKEIVFDFSNVAGNQKQERVDISDPIKKVNQGAAPPNVPHVVRPPENPIVVPIPEAPPSGQGGGFSPPLLDDWEETHKDIFM